MAFEFCVLSSRFPSMLGWSCYMASRFLQHSRSNLQPWGSVFYMKHPTISVSIAWYKASMMWIVTCTHTKTHTPIETYGTRQGCTRPRPTPFQRPSTRYNEGSIAGFWPEGVRLQGFRVFGRKARETAPKAPFLTILKLFQKSYQINVSQKL